MPNPESAPSNKPAHTNALAAEKSPYLLQHAHNPVDWHAWGPTAFERARQENKPVFLSIGYSTCHWCHVMERETFEDEAIGKFLNEHFVSIKVDREERPDVDKIYMTYVQATTGSGGWPLNVFLTPDLKPFYGGTYFPPEGKYGRPGFNELLARVRELWDTRHDDILASADEMHEQLTTHLTRTSDTDARLTPDVLREAAMALQRQFDPVNGGYGGAPKFPTPSLPALLLRHGVRHGEQELIDAVAFTCRRMAAGGIFDQLGGGFSRYAVDAKWLVPHFEKMLYDNAQLLDLYLDVFLITGDDAFADTARDIIRYLKRDMTHPEGGFYSAEDADSEGYEGKFYVWTEAQLKELLSADERTVVIKHYGVTSEGNFSDHSHPNPLPNQNVLSIVRPVTEPRDRELLASAKARMLEARNQRIRPHLDDKILSSWNGMMTGPLARAGVILGEPDYLEMAKRNQAFIRERLWDANTGTLHHRWRDGERDDAQLLDAYAHQVAAALHLYEATLEPAHLEFAIAVADALLRRFEDEEHGGFWQSPPDAGDLIIRVKEDYDGAQPSGNSVAIRALLRLAAITGRATYREAAERALNHFADHMNRLPQGAANMLLALDWLFDEPRRVVITGTPEQAAPLVAAAHGAYQPNRVVLGTTGPVEEFAKTLPHEDAPMAYLCTGTACQPPTNDPDAVRAFLAGK